MFRNIDDLRASAIEKHTAEYQLLSDANIIGGFEYGPYLLQPWQFDERKRSGDERWLLLRLTEKAYSADEEPWKSATKEGDYHGGGIPSELTALASLFLRRRIRLGALMRFDNSPMYMSGYPGYVDKDLIEGQSKFGELQEWFELVRCLKADFHFPFILAAKFYQQALELIEDKPDLAYLSLVSAIEVLSRDFPVQIPALSELDEPLAEAVEKVEDEQLRREIVKRIMGREHLIRRRFAAFIVGHVEEAFWSVKGRPEYGRVESGDLLELMRRVYDQRSRTLHTGEPFPPNVFIPPGMEMEMPLGTAMVVGDRRWEAGDFIPHTSFFERLVNHVLRNFLKRNVES